MEEHETMKLQIKDLCAKTPKTFIDELTRSVRKWESSQKKPIRIMVYENWSWNILCLTQ